MSQLKDAIRPYFFTARRLVRRELRLTDIGRKRWRRARHARHQPRPGDLRRRRYARKISYSQFGEDLLLLAGSHSTLEASHPFTPKGSEPITVQTRRLEDVLSDWIGRNDIDLLDVDCEGHDLTALESNDWHRFRPRIVLAESLDDPPSDLDAYMLGVGYRRLARFRLTYAFERQD